jgi:hypothetical protein
MPLEQNPAADGNSVAEPAPQADDGRGVVCLIARQDREVGLQQPSDLLGDCGEDGSGGGVRATSVATRRRAACWSASVRSSSRAWALAIAVATNSAKSTSRC